MFENEKSTRMILIVLLIPLHKNCFAQLFLWNAVVFLISKVIKEIFKLKKNFSKRPTALKIENSLDCGR